MRPSAWARLSDAYTSKQKGRSPPRGPVGSLLFFQEGADSGFFGYGDKVAGPEAGVYVGFGGAGRCGGAGDIFLLQDEDSLLAGLELGGADPGHVAGERKAEDDFISFEFWPFQDGLDLEHGFVPTGAVFGG